MLEAKILAAQYLQMPLKTDGSGSEAAAMTNHQQSNETPPEVYAKQPSVQSGTAVIESRQPSVKGQIITTAQDVQVASSVVHCINSSCFSILRRSADDHII